MATETLHFKEVYSKCDRTLGFWYNPFSTATGYPCWGIRALVLAGFMALWRVILFSGLTCSVT